MFENFLQKAMELNEMQEWMCTSVSMERHR
jgi:hypothetical protein